MQNTPQLIRQLEIINRLYELFLYMHEDVDKRPSDFQEPPLPDGFPIKVKTVQKRYVNWTALDKQGAVPAILMTYGDNGRAVDSDVVGFIDETFPIACSAVMKEGDENLIEQAAKMHYSIKWLLNHNRDLGGDLGVLPDKTRLSNWRGSEGAISKFEIIKFRVIVVHRYHADENV